MCNCTYHQLVVMGKKWFKGILVLWCWTTKKCRYYCCIFHDISRSNFKRGALFSKMIAHSAWKVLDEIMGKMPHAIHKGESTVVRRSWFPHDITVHTIWEKGCMIVRDYLLHDITHNYLIPSVWRLVVHWELSFEQSQRHACTLDRTQWSKKKNSHDKISLC